MAKYCNSFSLYEIICNYCTVNVFKNFESLHVQMHTEPSRETRGRIMKIDRTRNGTTQRQNFTQSKSYRGGGVQRQNQGETLIQKEIHVQKQNHAEAEPCRI